MPGTQFLGNMNTKNIVITIGTAAAVMAGAAHADIFIPYAAPEFGWSEAGKLTGNVSVSYNTKYVSRAMAVQDSYSDNSVAFQGLGQYTLGNNNSINAGLKYDWLANKGFDHYDSHHLLCDEGTGILQFAHRFNKGTVLAAGYQFVHGGLPGRTNYHHNGSSGGWPYAFQADEPEEHSIVIDFHHEFSKGLEGFFWDSRAQYVFRWVEGWWFINTLGYKYDVCDRASIVATATWTASAGYYNVHTLNGNGTQGYQLAVAVPYKVTDHVTIRPYISTVFIGNGADVANDKAADLYRDFTFVAGVCLQYAF